jgi:hypothetical protein
LGRVFLEKLKVAQLIIKFAFYAIALTMKAASTSTRLRGATIRKTAIYKLLFHRSMCHRSTRHGVPVFTFALYNDQFCEIAVSMNVARKGVASLYADFIIVGCLVPFHL